MMYEVLISHEAEKYYKKLDKNTKQRINRAIGIIDNQPLTGLHTKKLGVNWKVCIDML